MYSMRLVEIANNGEPSEPVAGLTPLTTQVLSATALFYQAVGFSPPWVSYLALENNLPVGICSFKGAPKDHRVEIAYFTFPEHHRRGIATRMAASLILLARNTDSTLLVAAQTQPTEGPSTKVLRKNGFTFIGERNHPKDGLVWEWQLPPQP